MKAGGTVYNWVRLVAILAGVALVIFLVVKLYGWITAGASWAWTKATATVGAINDGVVQPTAAVGTGVLATGAAFWDLLTTGEVSQPTIDQGRAANDAIGMSDYIGGMVDNGQAYDLP